MAKKKTTRFIVSLVCQKCKKRNYTTSKKKSPDKLKLKKYCKWCNSHTVHKEGRI